ECGGTLESTEAEVRRKGRRALGWVGKRLLTQSGKTSLTPRKPPIAFNQFLQSLVSRCTKDPGMRERHMIGPSHPSGKLCWPRPRQQKGGAITLSSMKSRWGLPHFSVVLVASRSQPVSSLSRL